jgi:hypothetical protein
MTARVLAGDVLHIWDHSVIALADEGRETGFISWYAITWSASLGAGNVALFEAPDRGVAAILADDPGLGERMRARLRGMGFDRPALADPPVAASFSRRPFGPSGFGVRVVAPDMRLDADWAGVTAPFWVDGEHGGFHATEDIWSAFVEAPDATLALNGERLPGRPFLDDHWVRVLGRALSSAHGALSEVRVTPTPAP